MKYIYIFKQTINEIYSNQNQFTGLNLTGLSMIDYKNINTMALISDIMQINEPINQAPQISVKKGLLFLN